MNPAADLLIVDDDPATIRLLGELLGNGEFRVRASRNSQEALRLAKERPPELFLLDVEIPQIDGYELCLRLKADEQLRDRPVIFVSAHEEIENKIRGFEVGGVDYICKPLHAEELRSRVRSHVELYRLRNRLQEEVDRKTRELSETLTALRVLMAQQREENQRSERHILLNINQLVIPFAERLGKTVLDERQQQLLDALVTNLKQVADSLIDRQDLLRMKLSPVEIQVVNLIREGKQTKEIAAIMNLSELTVSTHRRNIRRKLDIQDRKISLHSFLSTL